MQAWREGRLARKEEATLVGLLLERQVSVAGPVHTWIAGPSSVGCLFVGPVGVGLGLSWASIKGFKKKAKNGP